MDAHNITASPLAYKGSKYGSASNLVWNPDYGLKSKPVYMLLFIFMGGLFFFRNRMKWADGKLRSLQKINYFFA